MDTIGNDEIGALRAEFEQHMAAAERRFEQLAREHDDLAGQLARLSVPAAPTAAPVREKLSRRRVLGSAGAVVAAAGVAAVAVPSPAAAADGDAVLLGQVNLSSSNAATVIASSYTGSQTVLSVTDGGDGVAVQAYSDEGTGLIAEGGQAPMRLQSRSVYGPPSYGTHRAGELTVSTPDGANGYLYVCVEDGTPGKWRRVQLIDPVLETYARACAVESLTPYRLFDSRPGTQALRSYKGKFTAGKKVDIVVPGDATSPYQPIPGVPAGAGGVVVNVTVVNTVGSGFVTVYPTATGPVPNISTINWWAPNQVLANTTIVRLGTADQITVYANQATDVIIDVMGFLA
ncbi:hypothetical protein [Hamadaea tsunoensis]|uniref:hypothetical protein n=1 Tax=Hamadaea tsunoensis TaxID=53368 RepID=UPI0004167192|nr:hypothetical protein [Hamadaea tsunoensis]